MRALGKDLTCLSIEKNVLFFFVLHFIKAGHVTENIYKHNIWKEHLDQGSGTCGSRARCDSFDDCICLKISLKIYHNYGSH